MTRSAMGMYRRRQICEQLEQRAMLDGLGLLWGVDAGLSLSFVPDGTAVGAQQSQLFDTFDKLGPREAWQEAILRGFQTWARKTNADVGVVKDDGSDLGIDGGTTGDPRFGDIRIAAIPMASDYFATSIPTNRLVDGTWVGDVFFNSNAPIESLDDLFAVALHEAGHVFGLEHSEDSMSPMYRHDLLASVVPAFEDIAALQRNFGVRRSDSYESKEGGSEIELKGHAETSTPGIVFGDISSPTDVDRFTVEMPDGRDNGDTISVRLITDGISLLQARLRVETESGSLLGEVGYGDDTGAGQIVTLTAADNRENELIVRVSAAGTAPYDVGGYSIVASYDDSNVVPDNIINAIATSRLRSLEQDDIQRFFESSTLSDDDLEVLLDDDMGSDDKEGDEIELRGDDAFLDATRFVTMNALSSVADVDRFEVRVPPGHERGVVTVSLSSLTSGFRATVRIRDESGGELDLVPLVNGNSTTISQINGLESGDRLKFEVSRHAQSDMQLGNYELAVRFNQTAVAPNIITEGIVESAIRDDHQLIVHRTQLFQLGLEPSSSTLPANAFGRAQLLDANGSLITELNSIGGELATTSVLLLPGAYTVVVSADQEFSYRLLANVVDEPLGPDPIDPTEDPYCGYHFIALFQCFLVLGDVNGDGVVGFDDFLDLTNNYGKTAATRSEGDLNGDSEVNFSDFLILATNFGQRNEETTSATA